MEEDEETADDPAGHYGSLVRAVDDGVEEIKSPAFYGAYVTKKRWGRRYDGK